MDVTGTKYLIKILWVIVAILGGFIVSFKLKGSVNQQFELKFIRSVV